ncbi:MAG: hypothetical protein ABFD92_00110 [Planctomycetaceae bacterium]|nr:hypothetical protein [Planctomycetaceae bacterium]
MDSDSNTLSRQIAAKLTEALKERFPDHAESLEAVGPIIGPLVGLGIAEGQAAVDATVEGLTASDSYPAWRTIYEQATPDERVTLNDASRKRLMLDALGVLKRRQMLWDVLKIAAGVIGAALL